MFGLTRPRREANYRPSLNRNCDLQPKLWGSIHVTLSHDRHFGLLVPRATVAVGLSGADDVCQCEMPADALIPLYFA